MSSFAFLAIFVACQPPAGQAVSMASAVHSLAPPTIQTSPSTTLIGPDGGWFGVYVAAAGDVNADGYADVIVGAYGVDSTKGAAYVYHGSAAGLPSSPNSALYYPGSATTGMFGYALAGAGDVNGDGYDDVIVGARGSDTSSTRGEAFVYAGSTVGVATTPIASLDGKQSGGDFAIRVAGAGDMNGDGYDDVVVGAPGDEDDGSVYVFPGSSAGPNDASYTRIVPESGSYFGWGVAPAGDVNGDGYDDITVGEYFDVYVVLGSAAGATDEGMLEIDATRGYSAASAGDVNGDGHPDIAVGKYDSGKVDLFMGGAAGPETSASWSTTASDQLGWAVSCAGDLDGDGYDDLIIGSLEGDDGDGRVEVYSGGATGLAADPIASLEGNTEAEFGRSAAIVGDVNGDGVDDLLVGAMGEARAYLYLGGRDLDGDGHPEGSDCDDHDDAVFPGAEELCNGIDDDCDDDIDEDDASDATVWYADADGDGFAAEDDQLTACEAPEGYGAGAAPWDCDDDDPNSWPGAEEILGDGIDQDCDGQDEPEPEDSAPPPDDSGAAPDDSGGPGSKDKGCAGVGSTRPSTAVLALLGLLGLALVSWRRLWGAPSDHT